MSDLPPYKQSDFHFTASPAPGFQFGQKVEDLSPEGKAWVEGEKAGWKVIETEKEDPAELYALMVSAIAPRPVGFVSSVSESGLENLGLFSWFQMITHNPPLVMICTSNTPTGLKDTARNIQSTKGFVVNIISEAFVENANVCSMDAPADVSEWSFSGLTKEPSLHVKAPRVKESAFSMECELHEANDVISFTTGEVTSTLIIGLVKYIHVRKDMINDRGNVDLEKFRPIARMGDITYATLGSAFRIRRPDWVKDAEKIQAFLKKDA